MEIFLNLEGDLTKYDFQIRKRKEKGDSKT